MKLLKFILRQNKDFFAPTYCRLCDSKISSDYTYQICDACLNYISPLSHEERYLFHKEYLQKSIKNSFIYAHFDNHTRPILHDLKYNYVKSNGLMMGEILYFNFEEELKKIDYDAIISCPMHPEKEFVREYNQADLITKKISELSGIDMDKESLKRKRNTKTQTKLNKSQREKNLHNAFSYVPKKNYNRILIVDDVVTTGMTFLKISESINMKSPNTIIDIIAFATPYFN